EKSVCKYETGSKPIIVAYNNKSNIAIWETKYANGSDWDGVCEDTEDPIITLISPANNTLNASRSINFTAKATDNVGFANCSVYTDETSWSLKQTNTSPITNNTAFTINNAFSADGIYLWNMECCDISGNCAFNATNYTITIDTTAPVVSLTSPANNTLNTTDNTPDFSFNVTDEIAATLDCTLWLDSGTPVAYGRNSSTANATSTTITANASLSNDDYLWWINCSDGVNTAISEKRSISIDLCAPPASGNWIVQCSDYCNWTTDQQIPANLTLNGTGTVSILAVMNFTGANQYLFVQNSCEVWIESGGEVR
ncbi:hypothetical protein KY317_03850, partial [Candidatus Woesearchaeota archaeon]|nr:hypothetical protein [Candidatus Woesearchaeota archaeon]